MEHRNRDAEHILISGREVVRLLDSAVHAGEVAGHHRLWKSRTAGGEDNYRRIFAADLLLCRCKGILICHLFWPERRIGG